MSRIQVLDQGYVEFIEAWGGGLAPEPNPCGDDYECGIIEAARQSTQGAFRGWDQDAKLLRYLYNHHHTTPFEFAGFTIEVKLPIVVAREWIRHRTQSFNEASARYAPLAADYYVPTAERVMIAGAKQGGAAAGSHELTLAVAERFIERLSELYTECEQRYQIALTAGVPKELARLVMPVGHYTQWRASANLWNWLRFLRLRLDPAAQWEIRKYAEAVGQVVAEKFPRTWEAFNA